MIFFFCLALELEKEAANPKPPPITTRKSRSKTRRPKTPTPKKRAPPKPKTVKPKAKSPEPSYEINENWWPSVLSSQRKKSTPIKLKVTNKTRHDYLSEDETYNASPTNIRKSSLLPITIDHYEPRLLRARTRK